MATDCGKSHALKEMAGAKKRGKLPGARMSIPSYGETAVA